MGDDTAIITTSSTPSTTASGSGTGSEPLPPSERKVFVPLENNPSIMTPLSHHLGLPPTFHFHDILSFTDPDLLAFIPRPVHALMFLHHMTPTSETHFQQTCSLLRSTPPPLPPHPTLLWYPQTITHACGLIALLHMSSNSIFRARVLAHSASSPLARFITTVSTLPDPAARAQLIYDSAELEAAHCRFAVQGDSIAPDVHAGEDVPGAFIAFVADLEGRVWEMEGRRPPLLLGTLDLEKGEDLLSERVLGWGPLAYVRREREAGGGELRVSCLALVEDGEE